MIMMIQIQPPPKLPQPPNPPHLFIPKPSFFKSALLRRSYTVIYGLAAEVFIKILSYTVHISRYISYVKERNDSEVILLLGNLGNMIDLIQKVQQNVSSIQESLRAKRFVSASGNVVCVTVSGTQEIVSLELNEAYLTTDNKAMLEDLLLTCLNDALSRSREQSQAAMSNLAAEFNLPPIPGLF